MAVWAKATLVVGLAAIALAAVDTSVTPTRSEGTSRGGGWVTSWAQSQQAPARRFLDHQSMRMITRLSQGGDGVRIRVQNQFGGVPLRIGGASVALSDGAGPALRPHTTRRLTFHHRRTVTVPVQGSVWSDPVRLGTRARSLLAVSLYTPGNVRPGQHLLALRDNFLTPAGSGDHIAEASGAHYTERVPSTYVVSAVDVHNGASRGTVVAFGSSVVDGTGSDNCGPGCRRVGNDQRWSDDLARRVVTQLPRTQRFAVADAGIGDTASSTGCPHEPMHVHGLEAGPRLDRDVLALHGVRAVIYYNGMNDLRFGCTGQQILASYRAVFDRLHRADIKVFVVPPTPRQAYTARQDRYRSQIDSWVRADGDCGGACDGILDFGRVIADPAHRDRLDPRYDNGDGVHVDIAGQRAEADSIPLASLAAAVR